MTQAFKYKLSSVRSVAQIIYTNIINTREPFIRSYGIFSAQHEKILLIVFWYSRVQSILIGSIAPHIAAIFAAVKDFPEPRPPRITL